MAMRQLQDSCWFHKCLSLNINTNKYKNINISGAVCQCLQNTFITIDGWIMFYQNKYDMLESTGYTIIQLLYQKVKSFGNVSNLWLSVRT